MGFDLQLQQRMSWVLGAALVAFLACAAVHYLAVSRQHERLAALGSELNALRAQQVAPSTDTQELMQLQAQARELGTRVPQNTDLSRMLESLGAELDRSDVLDREISTRPTTAAGAGLAQIGVTVRFRAPFERAMSILEHVEGSPRLARLDRLVLERPASPPSSSSRGQSNGTPGSDARMLRVELEFSTFARTGEEQGPWAQLD